ncbi:MAG: hypothetical protein OEM52_05910, partial [bacterium]|nr:hypothetical protein [bacterium]
FWTAMFATVMSTVNSYSFLAAVTLGRDILWRALPRSEQSDARLTRYTQIGLGGSLLIAGIVASLNESVVDIWKDFGSVFGPALVLPLLTSWQAKWRMRKSTAFWAMLCTMLVALGWTMSKHLPGSGGNTLFAIEPIYPSIVTAILFWLVDRIRR